MRAVDLPLASTVPMDLTSAPSKWKDVAAEAANNTPQKDIPESAALARRYGQIGISAVAAAR
jgi:hypothetical protein